MLRPGAPAVLACAASMGTVILVRHGQASYLAADYDRLSPMGEEQASRLGAHWARLRVGFDVAYTGPRRRHLRTAELARAVLVEGGGACPEPALLDELDEIRGDFRPIGMAMDRWMSGELVVEDAEPWPDFTARVLRAIERLRADAAGGRRVIAFTSGGPIGVALHRALGLDAPRTLDLIMTARNGSVTEFRSTNRGGDRFTLHAFNAVPHLEDEPRLLTYR